LKIQFYIEIKQLILTGGKAMDSLDLLRIARRQESVVLTFRHLYDHHWGVIVKPRHKGEDHFLIMPTPGEFVPKSGEKYSCLLRETKGSFVLQGEKRAYKLVHAALVQTSSRLENKVQQKSGMGTMAEKLSALQKLQLPKAHNIFVAEVAVDPKSGELVLKSQFTKSDSFCGGKPSRRSFSISPKDRRRLLEIGAGKRVRCCEQKVTPSGKNAMNEVCLNVEVTIL